jgi:hypothetical protein
VIDGDTIVVAGQLVRLHGIDAPELDQRFWWRARYAARWHRPGVGVGGVGAGVSAVLDGVHRCPEGQARFS